MSEILSNDNFFSSKLTLERSKNWSSEEKLKGFGLLWLIIWLRPVNSCGFNVDITINYLQSKEKYTLWVVDVLFQFKLGWLARVLKKPVSSSVAAAAINLFCRCGCCCCCHWRQNEGLFLIQSVSQKSLNHLHHGQTFPGFIVSVSLILYCWVLWTRAYISNYRRSNKRCCIFKLL